eukprot:gnl/TRDRNA2_/TRDRNA2_208063_c0_seq1.p1 gnl/TRDRNA2_/TRDRNA2_208063_c0~~gnl/TRDRNA2_/TRDRNA2_208063_c0_seq1.p1  ORF type:complete len:314 (+),score=33.76 gnl/TRDRNA2_/TRDRNA2_208063_c0_seq1:56-943(+)
MDAGVASTWKTAPTIWLWVRVVLAVAINIIAIFGLAVSAGEQQLNCDAPLKNLSSLTTTERVTTPREQLYSKQAGSSLAPYWFIYLTNWGLMMQALYLNTAALSTYFYFVPHYKHGAEGCEPKVPVKQPLLVTIAWLSRTLALPGSLCITALYWAWLFPVQLQSTRSKPLRLANSLLSHVLNCVIQIADLKVSYEPFLFAGSFFVMQVYATAYFGWSIMHFATGVSNGFCDMYIYYFLDWGSPAFPIILFASFVLFAVPLFCGLSTCATKCSRPEAQRIMVFGETPVGKDVSSGI